MQQYFLYIEKKTKNASLQLRPYNYGIRQLLKDSHFDTFKVPQKLPYKYMPKNCLFHVFTWIFEVPL